MSSAAPANECVICCEEMEMRNYVAPVGEEATREVLIEDEETRLTCGHGYHTRCIIRSLTSSMKCPLCNTVTAGDMPDDVRMRIEGRGRILLEDVRKLPDIRAAMRVWRAEKTEFNAMEKEFKRRTKEFKENLRKELGTEEMIKKYSKTIVGVVAKFRAAARKHGPAYYAAFKNMSPWQRNRFVFKINSYGWRALSRWRLSRVFW